MNAQTKFATPEEAIEAMKSLAERERQAAAKRDGIGHASGAKNSHLRSTVPGAIVACLSANPGATSTEIAEAMGVEAAGRLREWLLRMAKDGRLRRWKDDDGGQTPYRYEVAK